jgi:hypothetical protein
LKRLLVVVVLLALVAPGVFAEEEPQARPGMVERALSWIGVKYRFGGQDEVRGFDCAGLVRRAFSTLAVDLPRTAAAQFRHGCIVPREELQPGDLVFFRNTYKRGISRGRGVRPRREPPPLGGGGPPGLALLRHAIRRRTPGRGHASAAASGRSALTRTVG